MRLVTAVRNEFGKLIYTVSYIPLWVIWNLGGRDVFQALVDIANESENARDIANSLGEDISNPEGARAFLAKIYLNECCRLIRAGAI